MKDSIGSIDEPPSPGRQAQNGFLLRKPTSRERGDLVQPRDRKNFQPSGPIKASESDEIARLEKELAIMMQEAKLEGDSGDPEA